MHGWILKQRVMIDGVEGQGWSLDLDGHDNTASTILYIHVTIFMERGTYEDGAVGSVFGRHDTRELQLISIVAQDGKQ